MAGRNVLYAQSGGVTAVINASACGVIETARRHPETFGAVYAARNGIIGALTEDLIDTAQESDADIAALRHTPGGAFGSCRYKLKKFDDDPSQYERLIELFRAHQIGHFFYNGGGDSADTCLKVSQLSEKLGYPISAIHIPKTVDNDLPLTDCCPGFGSVAKYVATSMLEAGYDVASMSRTSTKVFVMEVMGRHAGWITAACGLAGASEAEPPHILLFPEVPFDEARFLAKVQQCVERYDYCTIGVSEGLRGPDGKLMGEAGSKDAFGHAQLGGIGAQIAQLVKDKLGHKFHWAVADYLQRAARHIASRTDVEQAYAVGRAAVEFAAAGKHAIMVSIVRKADAPYQWEIGEADLAQVANVERKMPREFISADGFGITAACRRYLAPLIEGEDAPPFRDGLPQFVRLKNVAVPQRLKTQFKI